MRLAWYDYNIKFVSGKNLIFPDVLSRLPLSHFSERDEELLKEVETYIDAVSALVPATDKRLQEISEGLLSDATCSEVINFPGQGFPTWRTCTPRAGYVCLYEGVHLPI